jgi:hypothetical protein
MARPRDFFLSFHVNPYYHKGMLSMPSRTRVRDVLHEYILWDGGLSMPPPYSVTESVRTAQMSDATGPKIGGYYPDRVMTSTILEKRTGSTTNRAPADLSAPGDVGCPSVLYTSALNSWCDETLYPSASALANNLLASTNPGSPSMNLPLYMLELRDIPQMLRHMGDVLHKIRRPGFIPTPSDIAAGNLALEFGWKPLIEDLGKMLKFTEYVDRRMLSLERLAKGKGDKRKSKVFSHSFKSVYPNYLMLGRAPALRSTIQVQTELESVGTVTWKPTSSFSRLPVSRMQAMKLALGLNLGNIPLTIWQSIPWSWLIDWFAGVSNYIKGRQNAIYFQPTRLVIVNKTTVQVYHPEVPLGSGALAKLTAGEMKIIKKRRSLPGVPLWPSVRLPIFDNFKVSILGSLAVLRMKSRMAS